ncbi:50S ribosomal protein L22 [Candidatus Uhrbacteria bacterium]|nr:50S ribosomal protein L22 [Candidatus Uhrbacteria bacterium]
MEVQAKARYLRMSPTKVRLVIDIVRGMKVREAQAQLAFMKKAAAEPVLKLLNSAIANATHNFQMDKDGLYIKSIVADGGPMLGRFRARAMGRAAPIRKRSTHISIVLDEVKNRTKAKAQKKQQTLSTQPA